MTSTAPHLLYPVPKTDHDEYVLREGDEVFSPKEMIELPRPGAPVSNPEGDLALVSSSKCSFEGKKNFNSVFVVAIDTVLPPLEIVLSDGGDTFWLDSRTIGHVVPNPEDSHKTQRLYAISLSFQLSQEPTSPEKSHFTHEAPVLIGSLPVNTAANFRYSPSAGYLVFSAYVYADGDIGRVTEYDAAYEDRGNAALVYDHTFARQWDTWVGPKHKSLFTVPLSKNGSTWVLEDAFTNVLRGTKLTSPVEPFGGTDNFDVSSTHIVYTAKDPHLPKGWHTKQNIYYVDFAGTKTTELTSGKQGATYRPVFNSIGDKAAWLELDKDGDESDRSKVIIYDLAKDVRYTLTQNWDRSPSELVFSKSGDDLLYFVAPDLARMKVFVLPLPPTPPQSTLHPVFPERHTVPIALTDSGTASGLQALPGHRLLFALSCFISPNDIFVLRDTVSLSDRNEREIEKGDIYHRALGLTLTQITRFTTDALRGKSLCRGREFWFEGASGRRIQGWLLTPPGFSSDDRKKWPVLFCIHGGPEYAWYDEWSTHENLNVYTNQGYIIVAINPTGSTSFGQELTSDIKEDWGGKPFEDLRKGWRYVLDSYPQIDPERAVACGSSWGGYAMNWIQGHPEFGFGFKAMVCNAGIFDTSIMSLWTDELFFMNEDFGGRPWDEKSKGLHHKYSPSSTVAKWTIPELFTHGSKDYRVVETESIAPYHALLQLGIPTRLVIFRDENHFMQGHGNSLKWHHEVFRWFDQWVGAGAKSGSKD